MAKKIIRQTLEVLKYVLVALLAFVLILNVVSLCKRVFLKQEIPLVLGYGNAVIVSGSMEPKISVGDMIVVHKQNSYQKDDIITYQVGDETPVTHRIKEVTQNGYITQGDSNNAADAEITKGAVIGKVTMIIPQVGNVVLFFQTPIGVILLILGLFLLIELPGFIKRRVDARKEKKEAEKDKANEEPEPQAE